LARGTPLLVCGSTGTGKTTLVRDRLLHGLSPATYKPIFLNFSAQTRADVCQGIIDGQLDKRRKGIFGPPLGKKCIVFVDDLNMPALETYGAQPPIELLRQWMDHDGWYDLKECTFREIVDVQFVAAMGPPGGGRNPVTPRYLRHFNLIWCTDYAHASLERIFTSILRWHTTKHELAADLKSLSGALVASTIHIYNTISNELLPTPAKSHYTYNLRDIAKVIQGVLQSTAKSLTAPSDMVALWAHECIRVFADRLVDQTDSSWFHELLCGQLKERLKTDWASVIGQGERLLFGTVMGEGAAAEYVAMPDMDALIARAQTMLEDYNAISKRPMELVLFPFAVEHICRVLRIIRQPFGNALLVGVGGSGRQSLTTLACHMAEFELFQIELSKNYDKVAWREDLKRVLRQAGEKSLPTVFLFVDTQIKEEAMVEDLNNILNAGEVPNLFAADELAQVYETLATRAKELGMEDMSPAALFRLFVQQCRANLHMVLAMSPIGDAFRTRLRKFPALVNCCTIDWFTAWPEDALRSVAESFLMDVSMEDSVRSSILSLCCYFQQSATELSTAYLNEARRYNYVTPTTYLELLGAFRALLQVKRDEVSTAKSRYDVGLDKLRSTAEQVAGMQEELQALQPKLVTARAEADELMVVIEKDSKEAEATREVVQRDEAAASVKAEAAAAIKAECEEGLAAAIPALEAAVKALSTLKKADTDEVKAMKAPPAGVKLVMEAVCIMKEVPPVKVAAPDGKGKVDDYWEPAKKMMNDSKFLQSLVEYDKDNIPPAVIQKIRRYTTNPDFDPEVIKKASKAAQGLCSWVCAMEVYDRVAKDVAPKRAKLAEAEAEFNEVSALLEAKKAALKEVEDKLATLQATFKETVARKEDLEQQSDECEKKLMRAEALIGGLGGEKDRWAEVSVALGKVFDNITGDILIGSAVLSYMGPFTQLFRDRVVADWVRLCSEKQVPCSAKFSLTATLGDPVAIRAWTIDGLPNDAFSIDNGIILSRARRWPLMIDPQMQANRWVKNMEKDNSLAVFKLTDGDFARVLENALQFGRPALLENVGEELDPMLEPVLLKQFFKSAGVLSVRLGDATVEYNKDFKFYITTKLRNPHYLPEVSVKVTCLNFMITPEGLEDQLLGIVVAKERPELQEEKEGLVLEAAENKKQLQDIENRILQVLSESEGNILDDQTAIDILSSSKKISDDIARKQKIAEAASERLDATRAGYVPAAARASLLFFAISDMANVDPMYQYSLSWYIALFERAIADAPGSDDLRTRLQALQDENTASVYRNICRSLYEKDKLLFAFLLCAKIRMAAGALHQAHFSFFLTGGAGLIPDGAPPNPCSQWLPARGWEEILRLSQLPRLEGLPKAFADHGTAWKDVWESEEPHRATLPAGYSKSLSRFERCCVLRCLRPDRVVAAVTDFVAAELGKYYVEPPPFNLEACFNDSSNTSPLIFVLSPGQDPMTELLRFADTRGFGGKRTAAISLGQGQGPIARRLITEGMRAGSWVVLQNCHLCTSWMPTLEKICEELTPDAASPDFRLWLTSAPSTHFPVSILQNGVKMTNEPPKGLRANMLGSYLADPLSDEAFFEGTEGSNAWAFKKLAFGLAFFHAVIQERRKFGPIGWNIPYEFNASDLRISVRQVRLFLESYDDIPLQALHYCTGEANYGGRVTDDKDRRCLNALLSDVYCEAALAEGFALAPVIAADGSPAYAQPAAESHAEYLDAIRGLPSADAPGVFGLHENAAITKDLKETRELFDAILLTQARTGGGGGGGSGSDEMLGRIADDIAARLPEAFDLEAAQALYPVTYLESMNTVLHQELIRFNRLTAIIRSSLASLQKAIKGLVVMDAELEALAGALLLGTRPAMWMKRSYPSLKPLAGYVSNLLDRLAMFSNWIEGGIPETFWLSGFFFTHAFLTGSTQNYARRNSIPIDMLDFTFEVLEEKPIAAAGEGVYVHGMYLEGARYSHETRELEECEAKVLFVPLPTLWLRPQKIAEMMETPHYMCPLYKTSDRRGTLATTGHSTNFVMFLKLPSAREQTHWVKRGVAALCQLDD